MGTAATLVVQTSGAISVLAVGKTHQEGEAAALRRFNGGAQSRRWHRLPGEGGGTQSDVWVDETLSRTSQLERRVKEDQSGKNGRGMEEKNFKWKRLY